jgi:putative transposase
VLSRWSPFGALVFAQLAGRHRLREVVTSMASPSAALAARGVTPPQRSPLAEAHARRPAARSPSLVATLHARGQAAAPGHGVRFKHPRVSVDSTTISLGLPRCPWARDRTATGAIKVPTLLDPAGDLPALGGRTAGQRSDLALARGLRLPTGSLVAMERGASDDRCRCRLPQDTVDCLIRHKSPAPVQVTSRLAVSGHHGVSADQPIMRQGSHGHASPDVLRRVGARDPETGPHAGC